MLAWSTDLWHAVGGLRDWEVGKLGNCNSETGRKNKNKIDRSYIAERMRLV